MSYVYLYIYIYIFHHFSSAQMDVPSVHLEHGNVVSGKIPCVYVRRYTVPCLDGSGVDDNNCCCCSQSARCVLGKWATHKQNHHGKFMCHGRIEYVQWPCLFP